MAGSLEKIGRALKSMFVNSGINEALSNIVTKVAKWVEIPVSETMENQRSKVNLLAIELTSLNTSEERRKAIYDELLAISPKIVEGLKLENINTEQLQKNLARYNEEAIKKIAIQRAQEDLNEIQERIGKQTEKRSEAEYKLNNALQKQVKLIKGYNAELGDTADDALLSTSLTAIEKFEKIHEITMGIKNDFGNVAIDFSNLNAAGSEYSYQLEEENKLLAEGDNILAKYQEKYQSIMGSQGSAPTSQGIPSGDITEGTVEETVSGTGKGSAVSSIDKLADQQAEFRMRIINESKTLIEQENLAYEKRLKDADVFEESKRNSTAQHQEAFRILEQQHQDNLKKINDQAYNDDLLENQKNFDQVTLIRQAAHNNEMAALGTNEEAKKALEKKFQQEELERQQVFLNALLSELQQTVDGGSISGIDEKLLTDQQKENLKLRIEEVKLALSELGIKMSDLNGGGADAAAAPAAEKKMANVDIFGMSSEDWSTMINNIMNGKLAVEDVIGAVGALTNAWSMFYDIKNNLDQQDLQNYEAKTNTEKELLKRRLDQGIISQDVYNAQISKLDSTLEDKRKKAALAAARREKQVAYMNAIVNTASGVAKMLGSSLPPMNFILAALVGAMGGLQIAKIATTPLPQAYAGKYDVIGAQDGKKYRAGVMDSPGTGLVNSPSILVGEKPEIIIDPATTRNLQINYPEVLQAIAAARMPQFASGSYPGGSATVTERPLPSELYQLMAAQAAAIERLNAQLNKGIGAKLVADSDYMITHNKVSEDYDSLRNQVSLKS